MLRNRQLVVGSLRQINRSRGVLLNTSSLLHNNKSQSSINSNCCRCCNKTGACGCTIINKNIRAFHTSRVNRSVLDEGDEAIVFTCQSCNTQQAHAFSKDGFEKGVVTLICPTCATNYCIADNLAWYEDERNTEDLLATAGPYTLKKYEKKFDITPDDLKEIGLYEKIMERKAVSDSKKAAEQPAATEQK